MGSQVDELLNEKHQISLAFLSNGERIRATDLRVMSLYLESVRFERRIM